MGISAAHLPHIFDMFFQADRSYEQAYGGLGIGLTLVKRVVEMHGGVVEAHSAGVNQGCEFIVRLPFIAEPAQTTKDKKGPDLKSGARRRILVVDDYPNAAESLARWLRRLNHEVEVAFDGLEGIEAAEKFRPEIILLDIGMPHLNGYEAAERIRQQPWSKRMVLIALTGWGQEADRERSREAGFDLHLVKPVDYAQLAAFLAEIPSGQTENASLPGGI
jgi:CheY-like chemotaxis protein